MLESKKTAGRRKIKITRIDKESNRQVTFSKRKAGLFKKAGEISVMSGAQAAVFILSNKLRPYSFANPTSLLDAYLNGSEPAVYDNDNTTLALVDHNNNNNNAARDYDVDQDCHTLTREHENLWWWNVPVEGMAEQDFRKYKDLLEEMEMKLRIIVQDKKINMQAKEDQFSQCL